MYMRTTRTEVQPEKIDEAIYLFQATNNAPAHAGFVSGMFTADEKTGALVWRSLWATKKDAQAFGVAVRGPSGENRELASIVRNVSKPKIRHVVSVTTSSRGGLFGPPTFVRTTTIKPIAGKAAEVDRIYEESVVPAARIQPGFRQGIYLEDEAGGRRVLLALWDNEEALLESERNGYYQVQLEKLWDLVADPPTREVMPIRLIVPSPLTAAYYKRLGARVYDDLFGQGKLELIEELFSEEYVDTSLYPFPGVPTTGHEAVRAVVSLFRSAFPDLRMEVQGLYVEGDAGIGQVIMRGTHRGEFLGVPPTGKEVTVPFTDIVRFRAGKVVERSGVGDTLALLTQLGVTLPVAAQVVR